MGARGLIRRLRGHGNRAHSMVVNRLEMRPVNFVNSTYRSTGFNIYIYEYEYTYIYMEKEKRGRKTRESRSKYREEVESNFPICKLALSL